MTERARVLTVGGVLLGLVAIGLIVGFLVIDGGSTPPGGGSPSPTTDVRTQVEQAYLKVWDAWADALLNLDASRLPEVMTGNALTRVTAQVEEQRKKNQPVRTQVEHNYRIVIVNPTTASVEDEYINHSVRLDPKTREPIEKDPKQRVRESFTMRLVSGKWKLAEVIEYKSPSP